MDVKSILQLCSRYEKIALGAWRLDKIDRDAEALQLEKELTDATNHFKNLLRSLFYELDLLGVKTFSDRIWKSELNLGELDVLGYYIPVRIKILSDPKHKMIEPVQAGGMFYSYEQRILVSLYIQAGTLFTEEIFDMMIAKAARTLRHELQHLKQLKLKQLSKSLWSDTNSFARASYYLQDVETDANISSIVESAIEESKGDMANIEKLIETKLWNVRLVLKGMGMPDDVIRHSLDRIRRKYWGWIKRKYNINGTFVQRSKTRL